MVNIKIRITTKKNKSFEDSDVLGVTKTEGV